MNLFKKKLLGVATASLFATSLLAQTATPAAEKTVTSSNNQLATLLVITTIVFAFVIWGLGQVLVAFTKQAMEKNKANASKLVSVALILGLSLVSQATFAQTAAPAEATKVVPNFGGLTSLEFYLLATVIAVEIIAILFLTFSIRRIYTELLSGSAATAVQPKAESWWSKMDKKLFTKAVPIEKEADVLLDHDYDGIHELDNALPPWWKYGFYVTIGIAVIYLLHFHVLGTGKNPLQEYNAEIEKAKTEKAAFEANNKDKIDEKNVPMADAAGLQIGKELFGANCWPCHGKLGEGGAGPNLTDDYWIHKGSLNDIFHTISYGYPDKGMQSWAVKFNPKEISELASYVKTLHGTNPPNAKAPQGDLYTESATSDSTKTVKADSAVVVKK